MNFPPRQRAVCVPAGARTDLSRRSAPHRRADVRGCGRRHRLDAGVSALSAEWVLADRRHRPHAVTGHRRSGAAGLHGGTSTPAAALDVGHVVRAERHGTRRDARRSSTAPGRMPARGPVITPSSNSGCARSRSPRRRPWIASSSASTRPAAGHTALAVRRGRLVLRSAALRRRRPPSSLTVQGAGSFNSRVCRIARRRAARPVSAAAVLRGSQPDRHVRRARRRANSSRAVASCSVLTQSGQPRDGTASATDFPDSRTTSKERSTGARSTFNASFPSRIAAGVQSARVARHGAGRLANTMRGTCHDHASCLASRFQSGTFSWRRSRRRRQ